MNNYTPGPWEVHKYPHPNRQVKRSCLGISSHHVRDFITQYVLTEADARLIAAAPEMYELMLDANVELATLVQYPGIIDDDIKSAVEICGKIHALMRRIDGEVEAE